VDTRDGTLTTWNGTQVVHFVQQGLKWRSPPHKIRVIAPDVGGGFTMPTATRRTLTRAAIASVPPVKWS
jgi:CO/xanthine dehydrogenase Mo-binding subunit